MASGETSVLSVGLKTMDGHAFSLKNYSNKVVVLVITASQSHYKNQFKQLEDLYQNYKNDGLIVVAIPCNDFGSQEPGSNEAVKLRYSRLKLSFIVTEKMSIAALDKHPFFTALQQSLPTRPITWVFNKFIIDKKGRIWGPYESWIQPKSKAFLTDIEAALELNKSNR